MLVKVKFEKGAIGTPHKHYHTQTTYVASGKFEFTVGGEKKIVELVMAFTWNRTFCMVVFAWNRVFLSTVLLRCVPIF